MKRAICAAWLKMLRDQDRLSLSLQVLNEAYWVVLRKPAFAPARREVRAYLADLALWLTAPSTFDTVSRAWRIGDRHGVSWWDALLLASAAEARCSLFLSEDLADGQVYEGVHVIDPFRHEMEEVLAH
ncbi:MAG TPA: PIN domain-containing protein [Caulobacteraceae bacterium]|nr:PIN domain-containing protein [Caulobacteraceae bacterium]